MATRLIIDGNSVYEIDEDCLECQKKKAGTREGRTGVGFWSMDSYPQEDKQLGKEIKS